MVLTRKIVSFLNTLLTKHKKAPVKEAFFNLVLPALA